MSILFLKSFHDLFLFFLPAIFGLAVDGDGGAAGGGGNGGAGAGAAGSGAGSSNGAATGGSANNGNGASAASGGTGGAASGGGAAGAGGAQPLIGPDGNFIKGWSKLLEVPESLEAKFTSPKTLAKSFGHLETLINAKGLIKPGANATPGEVDAFYKALGRPDTAKDYGLSKPEKLMIGGKETAVPAEAWDQAFADEAAGWFHELGLSKEQASKLNERFVSRTMAAKANVDQMVTQQRAAGEKALRTEWGAEYDANVRNAQAAAIKAGMTLEQLNASPHLANDPVFIKTMAAVGKMIGENPSANVRGNSASTTNPAAEIAAIMADRNHAWHAHNTNRDPLAHKQAVDHMAKLYRLKNGEAA